VDSVPNLSQAVHACNALSPSCISLPVSANRIEVRVSMAEANNKQICQRHSSSALFLQLQRSWRSHSSGFGLRSKFVTSGVCLKSSLLPASVCLSTQTGLRLGFRWRKQKTSRLAKGHSSLALFLPFAM
jgi:hypothetical protein